MNTNELICKMNLYKQEIFRRGIVIGLCLFLPGIAVAVILGFWLEPFTPPIWKSIVFYAAILLFLFFNVGLFAYTIIFSLPKKLELFCPGCHKSILKINPEALVSTGKCDECAAEIIELPTINTPPYHDEEVLKVNPEIEQRT